MMRNSEAEAIAGVGLRGDRYQTGKGYYSPAGYVCQITLIEAEALERMEAIFGVSVSQGEHRRNLVTRGVLHSTLLGRRFAVGDVILECDRRRPPCGYLERLTQKGMTRAMGEGAGICARVIEGGVVREGDVLKLLPGRSAIRRLP